MKNKILDLKKKLLENRKRAVAFLLVGSMIMGLVPMTAAADTAEETHGPLWEANTGELNIVPYNNDIRVEVAAAGRGTPVATDYDGDGIMDLILSNATVPYCGTLVFYGTPTAQDEKIDGEPNEDYMFMENAVRLTESQAQTVGSTLYEYDQATGKYGKYLETLITCWGHVYGDAYPSTSPDYTYALPMFKTNPEPYKSELAAVGYNMEENLNFDWGTITNFTSDGNIMYVDYDGDGDLDIIHVIKYTGENGWEYGEKNRYDENGVWGDGDDPERCWIFWHENTATDGNNIDATDVTYFNNFSNPQLVTYTSEGKEYPVDSFGGTTPQFGDFDFDGDLDIFRPNKFGEFYYFENVESRTNPQYAKGRGILTPQGDILKWDQIMVSSTRVDWNEDGYMDIVVCEESGRAALIQHTGEKSEDGTPIMNEPVYFQMPAEGVKPGMEASPFSVDWDDDGDEDMLVGTALGQISFVENLSIIKQNGENVKVRDLSDPSWAKPVLLRTPDEEVYQITAGDSLVKGANGELVKGGGSPQGTHEFGWGYTTITVADWDNDDVPDIISNNIWGKVYFHKGIEGDPLHVEEAQPVEVEWENGNISPDWNWWKPEGKELVIPWRSTAFAIDLPLDKDGDGTATGDGLVDLVAQDCEGYLAFYERYQSSDGTLKLKQGKRIFQDSYGEAYRIRIGSDGNIATDGESGRVKFTLVDYDTDGMLDIIYTDDANGKNVVFAKNMSTTPGEYVFSAGGSVHERKIYDHSVSPTVCNWNKETDPAPDLLMGAEDGHIYYLINNVVEREQEEVETIDDHLVAHWDFEGTGDEVYKDKAPAGSTKDNLSVATGSVNTGEVVIENGIATITGDKALMAADAADLDQTGKMTVFTRIKFDDSEIGASNDTGIFDKRINSSDPAKVYSLFATKNGTKYNLNFNMRTPDATEVWVDMNNALEKAQWRELAVVVDHNENGYLTYKVYISKSTAAISGNDYTLLCEGTLDGQTEHAANDRPLYLGNQWTLPNSNSERMMDDVRIYDTALTTEELAGLIADEEEKNYITEEDLPGFQMITVDDFVSKTNGGIMESKTYTGSEDFSLKTLNSFDKTLLSLKLDYSTYNGPNLRILGLNGKDLSLLIYPTTRETALWVRADDYNSYHPLSSQPSTEIAATSTSNMTTFGEEFILQLSIEYGDFDADADTESDDIRMGIYFNGVFYGYIIWTECEMELIGTHLYLDIASGQSITISRVGEVEEEDPSLVAHWDFEGDNDETRLADKASGNNPLISGGDAGTVNFTAEAGKATITGNGYLRAAAAGINVTESMTVFVRAKVSAFSWDKFLHKQSDVGGFELGTFPGKDGLMLGYKNSDNHFAYNSMVADEWREIAIVVHKDEQGFYHYEFLVSKNEATADGDDFVSYAQVRQPVALHVAESTPLTIGNDASPGYISETRVFDDIQIYNRALTADELAALINPSDLADGENDTTSYYLTSLDNNAGFSYFEHRTTYTAETYKDSVTLTPEADDDVIISVKVNSGNETVVASGAETEIALNEGSNTITITVGDARIYTVTITRNPLMNEKLATLVEKVGKYENTGYDAWDAFATVLSQAEALLALENPSDGDLTDVYNALIAAEKQLFEQENLPAVSLKGFTHVTLEDFGLESKLYTGNATGNLTNGSYDKILLSMKMDCNEYSYGNNRIDFGNAMMLYPSDDSDPFRLHTNNSGAANNFWDSMKAQNAGITSGVEEVYLQMSFEFMDYNGDGTDDGVHVQAFFNGKLTYEIDMTSCNLSLWNNSFVISLGNGCSLSLTSSAGDAHGDRTLDVRDLVAVQKKAQGIELDATYENTFADVNHDTVYDDADVTAIRSKLLGQ